MRLNQLTRILAMSFTLCILVEAFVPSSDYSDQPSRQLVLSNDRSSGLMLNNVGTTVRIEVCNSDSNTFQLKSLSTEPETPRKGEHLKVVLNGHLSQPVLDGTALDVKVRYRRIPILSRHLDLCQELGQVPNVPEQCPIQAGEKQWIYEIDLPADIPAVSYSFFQLGITMKK